MIKNKLYSVMDEEGNMGYYLYNESTGEEKLFSVVEEERLYANVRHLKKAGKELVRKSATGKLTTRDMLRINGLKGQNSIKALDNKNFNKVHKGYYNQYVKSTGTAPMSQAEGLIEAREVGKSMILQKKNLRKGELKAEVDALNRLKQSL